MTCLALIFRYFVWVLELLGGDLPSSYNIHVHFWIIAMRRHERGKLLAHFGGGARRKDAPFVQTLSS